MTGDASQWGPPLHGLSGIPLPLPATGLKYLILSEWLRPGYELMRQKDLGNAGRFVRCSAVCIYEAYPG